MAGVLEWVSQSGVVQGIIIGATFAFLTAILVLNLAARTITTTVNGWSSIRTCGQPDNGVLVRAASAKALPVVNVFEEAAYWTTTTDGSGQTLSGGHDYLLSGPGWKGSVPSGMVQIASPSNPALVIGRVFVASESDQPTAYALAQQIQLAPLNS